MLRLFRKAQTFTVNQLATYADWLGYRTSSGRQITERGALEVTAVFCACRVIAEGIAQMPGRLLKESFTDNRVNTTVVRDHWAHKLLCERPNGWQTPYEFIEGMVFNAALSEAAIAIKNVARDEVRELLPVPNGAWTVEQNADYSLTYKVNYADKTHDIFSQDQVFVLRGPGIDGFKALPAIKMARESIGLSFVLQQQQAKLAGNGGKPSGVLSFAQPLAPETKEKLRETWQQKFGPDGDGGVAILDGDAKFSSMVMTSVDAQHIETRRLQIEEIARAFRVQPIMLMQADKAATFASAEQMFRMHTIHTLGPWIRRLEERVKRDVLPNGPLKYDIDERVLLRGDHKDQAEYYTKALGSGGQPGWMATNEVRAERGMNPIAEEWANKVPRGAINPSEQSDGTGSQVADT